MRLLNKILLVLSFFLVIISCQNRAEKERVAFTEPSVFFKNIQNGAVLSSPFVVEMGVEGMEVEPSGPVNRNKGHHHIIIDRTCMEDGEIIPVDKQHIHYGGGQTEAELNLEPGNYSLTLQFANGMHQSYGNMCKTINVTIR
tara:strand:+ start:29595 stop:30020 length:426 start_codon:yes stop_codon:yes gene_type:complete